MTEPETEAETLERLEKALRRIGELTRQPKTFQGTGPETDRESVLHSLDQVINRLRSGLELPGKPGNDGVSE